MGIVEIPKEDIQTGSELHSVYLFVFSCLNLFNSFKCILFPTDIQKMGQQIEQRVLDMLSLIDQASWWSLWLLHVALWSERKLGSRRITSEIFWNNMYW